MRIFAIKFSPMRILIALILTLMLPASGLADGVVKSYDESDGLSSHRIGGGIQDSNGLLWFATANGLNCYDGYEFHHIKIRPGDKASVNTNHIRDIFLTGDSAIVCHTDDDIYEFNLNTYRFCDVTGPRKDSLMRFAGIPWNEMTDAQGNRWSADHKGLHKHIRPHHPAGLLPGSENRHPRVFLVGDDSVLIAGFRERPAIATYSPDGKLLSEEPLPSAPYAMLRTSSGDIWVGCKPAGLYRYGSPATSLDAVYDIKEDRFGHLWIATFGNGIKCCPNPSAPQPQLTQPLGGKKVRQLLITPDDRLLAATTDGLITGRIDSTGTSLSDLTTYRRDGNAEGSISSNAIMSLAQDPHGNIFICTESSGCDVTTTAGLDAGNTSFRHFNTSNSSLASDICRAMTMADDSTLMIIGNDNMMLFNPFADSCVNFNKEFWGDSCRFTEATPLRLADGTVLLGAEHGALAATAHNIYSRGYMPPLVFTSWSINGKAGNFAPSAHPHIVLDADSRNISLSFAAIDFTDNSGILYRTSLDGSPYTRADRSRRADLFNLSPGKHRLEVQSTDRYGRRVENTRYADIEVLPYWHETLFAKIIFVLLLVAAVWAVTYTCIYIRRVDRERRELLEKYMTLMHRDADTSRDEVPAIACNHKPEVTALLDRVRQYIAENIGNAEASVDGMAAAAAVSRSTLNRHLRAALGVSASQLLSDARMQHAARLLRDPENAGMHIAEIADMCGYADHHYFRRVFTKKHGCTPAEYREG